MNSGPLRNRIAKLEERVDLQDLELGASVQLWQQVLDGVTRMGAPATVRAALSDPSAIARDWTPTGEQWRYAVDACRRLAANNPGTPNQESARQIIERKIAALAARS